MITLYILLHNIQEHVTVPQTPLHSVVVLKEEEDTWGEVQVSYYQCVCVCD